MIGPVYWMKRQMMKRGQTVDEPRTALSENIDCLLTFQGNAHPWGKNALIFAVKYQHDGRLFLSESAHRVEWHHIHSLLPHP